MAAFASFEDVSSRLVLLPWRNNEGTGAVVGLHVPVASVVKAGGLLDEVDLDAVDAPVVENGGAHAHGVEGGTLPGPPVDLDNNKAVPPSNPGDPHGQQPLPAPKDSAQDSARESPTASNTDLSNLSNNNDATAPRLALREEAAQYAQKAAAELCRQLGR